MMSHEVEISWQMLRGIIRRWAGDDADVEAVTPLAGGSINTTLGVTLKDGRKAVLKITPHRVDRNYIDEAWQLALLGEVGLPVPAVYQYKLGSLDEPFSYLLMEFVEGKDLAETRALCSPEQYETLQVELASHILKLHERTHHHFQRSVGSEQFTQYDAWHECYRACFEPIWKDVAKSGVLPIRCRKIVSKVHDRLDRFLAHEDCPRLLHWDLWSTNLLCKCGDDGQWHVAAFLDPHCKYGHAEAELAYLELFQTVTSAFMKAYQQSRKLTPEYHQMRKPVYQLYSMLNDLRLFGQEYLKPTLAAIDRVGHLV